MIGPIALSLGRAVWSQFHYRMLMLTVWPFLAGFVLWGVVLWLTLQMLVDALQALFVTNGWFGAAGSLLNIFGLASLKAFLAPLLAMWLLLPLVMASVLLFVGLFAMPAIARHVSTRDFAGLEKKQGGSIWGSLWTGLSSLLGFLLMWIVTLPLAFIPPLGLFVQPLLWGWLAARVMSYDALAPFADAEERRVLLREHRWPLLAIGIATGALGAVPTLFGVWFVLAPFLALPALWLYVLAFVFAGLWFHYYCLAALVRLRGTARMKDITPPLELP